MELTLNGIQNKEAWEAAGVGLPGYDVKAACELAKESPRWVHFGAGNIFRLFIGGIADELLEKGLLDRGINCVETFDEEIVDKIYTPHDNLALSVLLLPDGRRKMKVLGSLSEAVKAGNRARMKALFESESLQLVSFTITEKGYALKNSGGSLLPPVKADMENGPDNALTAMGILTAGLLHRYRKGRLPVALVSMDNCAQNGRLLKRSVSGIAQAWLERGFVSPGFSEYLQDETAVAFCSTMIDKITPRPDRAIADELEKRGVRNMQPVETARHTYIAPFANGERAQYLVIEDRFPNGRPPLEEAYGVYTGDFETVNKAERMKVTALLNPVHTATGPLGVVLGRERFADMLNGEPVMMKMAKTVAYTEGMPMAPDPGILSPQAFADELFTDRFVNVYLGDTNLRLCTDASQGLAVRFGETVKAYVKRDGSAEALTAVPLGIAGWLRYMLGTDDRGQKYTLAPDPMNGEITAAFTGIEWGRPETVKEQLRPILSNEAVFGVDLYAAGLGERIETMFREMLGGPGAALETVKKYMADLPDVR